MHKTISWSLLFATLIGVVSGVLRAVAVPPELIQTEAATPYETLYGFILIVFVVGIILGVLVQKKLNQPLK